MTNFKEKYNELLNAVEKRIFEIIPTTEPRYLYDPFQYIMEGSGKRIRPILCMMSAGACGGNPYDAIDCAAAIEILHNFTLVHDDIMDKSDFRRGKENIHKKWDEATAILTGDMMVAFALKILPKDHKRSLDIYNVFIKGYFDVNEGQGFDMFFNTKKDATYHDYLMMITKKTASLIMTPALMGGLIADADENYIEALRKYAYNIGVAFQIQDDYLDMTADESVLGKKTGLDIIEGKKTCLILKLNELNLEPDDRLLLDNFYESNGLPAEYITKFDTLFKKYGVYQIIEAETEKFFKRAEEALEILPNNNYKNFLKELIVMLDKREK